MKGLDLVGTAIGNSFRSKTRTILTVLAIFIGAFTLTLTSGVGTGINQYIDKTVSSIGASDVLTVSVTQAATTSGPQKYDPNKATVAASSSGRPAASSTITALTSADITKISAVSGVLSVQPSLSVRPDYVVFGSGQKYQLSISPLTQGIKLQLATGTQLDPNSATNEIALPEDYVKPLGLLSDSAAIGKTVSIGITNAQGVSSTVDATVTAVTQAGLAGNLGASTNNSLTRALYNAQTVGLASATKEAYSSATVRFNSADSAKQVTAIRSDLTKLGFTSTTVADQIGSFKTVIDAIILVLNSFAVIALLAASFGIVNTLLMSVQERTREIGLMKAMGMSAGKVFGLFSYEAIFIGFLGSAIGSVIAMGAGGIVNAILAKGFLANLPGLTLVAFAPSSIITIILIVMAIAFLAGTIPALRAARQDPIESLRYE
jgi:putative ABC transport system permease protein